MNQNILMDIRDDDTGMSLVSNKVVDVSDFTRHFCHDARVLFTQAQRGRLMQLRLDGSRIHYFIDEPDGQTMMFEDCQRFGFQSGGLNALASKFAPPVEVRPAV